MVGLGMARAARRGRPGRARQARYKGVRMFFLGLITGVVLTYGTLWLAAKAIEQGWFR